MDAMGNFSLASSSSLPKQPGAQLVTDAHVEKIFALGPQKGSLNSNNWALRKKKKKVSIESWLVN